MHQQQKQPASIRREEGQCRLIPLATVWVSFPILRIEDPWQGYVVTG